jgi:hypothetical protein
MLRNVSVLVFLIAMSVIAASSSSRAGEWEAVQAWLDNETARLPTQISDIQGTLDVVSVDLLGVAESEGRGTGFYVAYKDAKDRSYWYAVNCTPLQDGRWICQSTRMNFRNVIVSR